MKNLNQSIVPFLTFCGNAEEAMNFYISVFPDSKVNSLVYFTGEPHGEVGKVLTGEFLCLQIVLIKMNLISFLLNFLTEEKS